MDYSVLVIPLLYPADRSLPISGPISIWCLMMWPRMAVVDMVVVMVRVA